MSWPQTQDFIICVCCVPFSVIFVSSSHDLITIASTKNVKQLIEVINKNKIFTIRNKYHNKTKMHVYSSWSSVPKAILLTLVLINLVHSLLGSEDKDDSLVGNRYGRKLRRVNRISSLTKENSNNAVSSWNINKKFYHVH